MGPGFKLRLKHVLKCQPQVLLAQNNLKRSESEDESQVLKRRRNDSSSSYYSCL